MKSLAEPILNICHHFSEIDLLEIDMMKKPMVLILVFWSCVLQVSAQQYSVANAHSHNDYEQPHPYWAAYNAGFGSIEADVFLQNDTLLVAHTKKELALHKTLETLYLDPLAACISKNGTVFAEPGKQLQLLIDVKTDALPTLKKLIEILGRYPTLINASSLHIVISGNRPDPSAFSTYPSFLMFDGLLSKRYSKKALKKISLLSESFKTYVHGDTPTKKEWRKMERVVERAHKANKSVRFWATPDTEEMWQKLIQLQVDYINTDHIEALSNFLHTKSSTH